MSELLTPATIAATLAERGISPSRALGQNFLADPNTARKIVRLAEIGPGDTVVEVGPGLGSLTNALLETGAKVIAVELDRHLLDPLRGNLPEGAPVEIIHADALTADWDSIIGNTENVSMVANLPYNVATPVVIRALETCSKMGRYLVMVQREVGERFAAKPSTKAYGAVTVKVAYYGKAKVVGYVPANVFIPKPKVESALVQIECFANPPVHVDDAALMFSLVRAGFATRRKMLRQSLRSVLADDVIAVLERTGIDPTTRAEVLELDAWAALANNV